MLADHEANCAILKAKCKIAHEHFNEVLALPWYKDIFLRKMHKSYKEAKKASDAYLDALREHTKALIDEML